jgi:hypothetical protein
MQRIKFILLCVFFIFLIYSCDPIKDEKIKVINQTGENVLLYYYSGLLDTKSILARLLPNETIFILVSTDIKYYAEGVDSGKNYGSRTFSKVPSNWDVQQTWVILDH